MFIVAITCPIAGSGLVARIFTGLYGIIPYSLAS